LRGRSLAIDSQDVVEVALHLIREEAPSFRLSVRGQLYLEHSLHNDRALQRALLIALSRILWQREVTLLGLLLRMAKLISLQIIYSQLTLFERILQKVILNELFLLSVQLDDLLWSSVV